MTSVSVIIDGNEQPVAVAGGGGGAGRAYINNSPSLSGECLTDGGNADYEFGWDGGDGCASATNGGGFGGHGATSDQGGAGGEAGLEHTFCDNGGGVFGMDGGPLAGGDGGDGFYNTAGGGGGGGYFGGGGGAGPCWGTGQGGGGGGGGSSFLHSDWELLGHGAASVFCNVGNMWPNGSCQDHGRATIIFYGEYTLEGCLDGLACNYNASATQDNGSCLYGCSGCSDSSAANFNPTATVDDGSCVYPLDYCGEGTVWDEDSQTCIIDETYCSWQPDSDGDQLIGVSDLLMFLSVFGDTDLDQDGIFDSNDDCVGEYDECGVCNGSGPSIPVIESIEILYDSVYAEQIDEWLVYEYADTTFSFTCYEWSCGYPLEYQGYDYETVEIGGQCWFAENLRADTYLNGDSILFVSDTEEWGVQSGAMTRQPDNLSADLGALYNWLAVDDSRGLCPSGWHVSTDSDWQLLNLQAGLPMDELETTGWLGGAQEIGNKLKDPDYWNGGQGYDLFGFGARAGGYMNSGGTDAVGANGDWWTKDVPPPNMNPIRRGLHANEEGNLRCRCSGWNDGFSIRCVKDTE